MANPHAFRALLLAGLLLSGAAAATEPPGARDLPPAEGEPGYEQPWKVTTTFLRNEDGAALDVNVRRKLGPAVVWVGGYLSGADASQARLGGEWDIQAQGLLVAPAAQVGTNGSVGGQLYAEAGGDLYAILGAGRTNARSVVNLTFDPNDCWQLGAGWKLAHGDRLYGYVVWDARYGTGQQVSHLFFRHWVGTGRRLTLDGSWKSGHGDGDEFVRGVALVATWDAPAWFVRGAFDQHASFQPSNMVRIAFGGRF